MFVVIEYGEHLTVADVHGPFDSEVEAGEWVTKWRKFRHGFDIFQLSSVT